MKNVVLMSIVALFIGCSPQYKKEKYEADWESLSQHNESPDWFSDAKLGIYFHWGVYSVPAYGNEWYPRNMHMVNSDVYKHHTNTYGPIDEFGYHHFVPMFKAEKFNAAEWVNLFEKAGARFIGPVAEHHDGFSMWDSKITPWNSMDKGPRRDIVGEIKTQLDKRGIKMITTFHHSRNLQRYHGVEGEVKFHRSHYPLVKETFPASTDDELKYLYGNMPEEQWNEEVWFGKLKEVIDNYQPDIIWFDSWLDQLPENYRQKFCAYYLNQAEKWGKEVVIVRKQDDLPLDCSVDDLEKSRKNKMGEKVWMTDETISKGSWCYTSDMTIKPANEVLHVLIDIVSKNGVLLLNVSPKADGSIPSNQQDVLLTMGEWLQKYGEAIYDTRPWYTYGEGPTKEPEGHFKNHKAFLKVKYTKDDIRYTKKANTIYATTLGKPASNANILLEAFGAKHMAKCGRVKGVEILGCDDRISWSQTDQGLIVKMTEKVPDEMSVVIKINVER
ncbi:alpha-L-fucosidase [Labilibacter sediminis]|nr:alpha-L-fucosidase [Labilibacter sediminis]